MGLENLDGLRDVGKLLAFLKEPKPPSGWRDLWENLPKAGFYAPLLPCHPWHQPESLEEYDVLTPKSHSE